jgi:hypothetical protein
MRCKTCKHLYEVHDDIEWFNAKRAMFGYIPNKKEKEMKRGRCKEKDCECKEYK